MKDDDWTIDSRCIRCDAARHWAPGLIGTDALGRSRVERQPATPDEVAMFWRAAVACPTQSIRNAATPRAPEGVFPLVLTPDVSILGHNSRRSFGAHSYLVQRPDGHVMTEAPRFERRLVERIDALGGVRHVLLGHRDDIGDAQRWAEHYGARVWIHRDEADAAPFATDVIDGERAEVAPGVLALLAPGHTQGHLVFHVDERWLFTGDTLHWNPRRNELDVTPLQTWYSWAVLTDTVEQLASLHVEGVFPTHGMWRLLSASDYRTSMQTLATGMRAAGQESWGQREGTTYGWYR